MTDPRSSTLVPPAPPQPDSVSDPALLAAEALRLAMVSPDEAATMAAQARRVGMARGDWALVSLARRASGVAALHQWQLGRAVAELREAVKAADRAGEPALAGEAYMSLASALVLRGVPEQAFDSIEAALARLSGASAARARSQRAAILQEMGRGDEALEDLRLALPALRRHGDAQWEMQALSNRSLLLTDRRRFAAAEADLRRARQLCAEHGLTLAGGYVEQNLGCLYAGQGDVPAALDHFDNASARYEELGVQVASLLVDRANVLLSVRLVAEARDTAEEAVEVFARQGRKVHLPEAQLLLSTTSLLQDDTETALSAARSAARAFSRLGRQEWLALARFAQIQAQVAAAESRVTTGPQKDAPAGRSPGQQASRLNRHGVTLARIRASATELERAGWVVPALEARLFAGVQAIRRGRPQEAVVDLALGAQARRSGPAEARARGWLAEALLREVTGRRQGAKAALRAGLRVLDDYRATLGATELRAHVTVYRGALARHGVRMALAENNARAVFWWAERGRSSATALRAVRPPDDPELLQELQDLRATMAEIEAARGSGHDSSELVRRQVRIEHQIRDHSRRSTGGRGLPSLSPPSIGEITALLDGAALVEFVEFADTLHAVTVVDGRARLQLLGPAAPVRHWITHIPFALHRLAHPATRPKQLQAAR
ncbi:MAG TPA: tetratricopeptide repeat protein, partial [Propionibacteriaceae bacterium]